MAIAMRLAGRYRLRQMLQGRSRATSPQQRGRGQRDAIVVGDGFDSHL